MEQYLDDRTTDEKRTLTTIIAGKDTFLTGWGEADGVTSYAAWACTPEDRAKVLRWVRNRSDMAKVQSVDEAWRPSVGSLYHIYAVNPGHPALR